MPTLMYLCYGGGAHVHEAVFSILSARRQEASAPILVLTDNAEPFAGLDVQVEQLSQDTLQSWTGPNGYIHRRKITALAHALSLVGRPVILIDTDTWFIRPPSALFSRVGPGRAILHLPEGRPGRAPVLHEWEAFLSATKFLTREGRSLELSGRTMWNSGVIGLHPADAEVLDRTLDLIDQMAEQTTTLQTIEQFAVGCILEDHTALRSADDVVFHYWMHELKKPFHERLATLLTDTESLSIEERAIALYGQRPRFTFLHRRRLAVKRLLQKAGFVQNKLRSSGDH